MNLYLLTQNDIVGYDTYNSCVVCAESEEEARKIHPDKGHKEYPWANLGYYCTWARSSEHVEAQLIGKAAGHLDKGVILASFNAG